MMGLTLGDGVMLVLGVVAVAFLRRPVGRLLLFLCGLPLLLIARILCVGRLLRSHGKSESPPMLHESKHSADYGVSEKEQPQDIQQSLDKVLSRHGSLVPFKSVLNRPIACDFKESRGDQRSAYPSKEVVHTPVNNGDNHPLHLATLTDDAISNQPKGNDTEK